MCALLSVHHFAHIVHVKKRVCSFYSNHLMPIFDYFLDFILTISLSQWPLNFHLAIGFQSINILAWIKNCEALTRSCCDLRKRNGCGAFAGATPDGCNGTPGSGITCWTGRFGFNANFFKQTTRFSHINDTSSIRCSTCMVIVMKQICFENGFFYEKMTFIFMIQIRFTCEIIIIFFYKEPIFKLPVILIWRLKSNHIAMNKLRKWSKYMTKKILFHSLRLEINSTKMWKKKFKLTRYKTYKNDIISSSNCF